MSRFTSRTRILSLSFIFLPIVVFAQERTEDSFDSGNKTTTVREPVTDAKRDMFKVPYKIQLDDLKEKKSVRFDDMQQLKTSLYQDVLVTGIVESVYIPKSNDKVILNLGKDSRQCFKVVIDQDDFLKFGSKSPQRIGQIYHRKPIAVNGLLTEHNYLPQIIVTLPYQIEVVVGK